MLKQSQTKRGHRCALEMHRACPSRLPSPPHFSPSVPTSLHRSGFSDVCHRLDSLLPLSLVSMPFAVPCAIFIGLGGFLSSAEREGCPTSQKRAGEAIGKPQTYYLAERHPILRLKAKQPAEMMPAGAI